MPLYLIEDWDERLDSFLPVTCVYAADGNEAIARYIASLIGGLVHPIRPMATCVERVDETRTT